jgi:lipid A ethanolaminephosphotransferase
MPDHNPLRLPSDAEGGPLAPSRGTNKALSATWACLGTASWIVAVDNFSFWKTFASAQDSWSAATLASTAGLGIFLALLFAALLRPFVAGRVGAVLLSVLLIVSASVAHYLDAWGVLFDKGLVRNMVETDTREVRELLSLPAFVDVFCRGVLPAAMLWFVGIRRAEWKRSAIHTVLLGVVAAGVASALLATWYGTLAPTFRNHRELRFQLVPTNYINAVYGYLKGEDLTSGAILQIAPDARRTSGELLPGRLCARDECGPRQPRHPVLSGRRLVWHRHRDIVALHVLRAGCRGFLSAEGA